MDKELLELRNKLVLLVYDYDEYLFHESIRLKNSYASKFSKLENEIDLRRLEIIKKQKLILKTREKENNGLEIDWEKLNEEVELECLELSNKVIDHYYVPTEVNVSLSLREKQELKIRMKSLISKLHEVVNPLAVENKSALFKQSLQAFKDYDLYALRYLDNVTKNVVISEDYASFERNQRKSDLITAINFYQQRINKLLNGYPFDKKDLINNETKGIEYINQLNNKLLDLEAEIEYLDKVIEKMKKAD